MAQQHIEVQILHNNSFVQFLPAKKESFCDSTPSHLVDNVNDEPRKQAPSKWNQMSHHKQKTQNDHIDPIEIPITMALAD